MSSLRNNALEAATKANLAVVEQVDEILTQWKDRLITSNECHEKLQLLFFKDFQETQDFGSKEVADLSK